MITFVYVVIILLAVWALIKSIFYGIYEIRTCENKFGGGLVILFAIGGFVLFSIFIFLQ